MLNMGKIAQYGLVFLVLVFLVLIRWFQNDLFYDPYLSFFKNDFLYLDAPKVEVFKLTAFTSLRYVINTILSLTVIKLLLKDNSIIKFSVVLYSIAYVLLLILFLYFVLNPKQENYYLLFNIRRFLIQPVILIILLPAFYYYKLKQ